MNMKVWMEHAITKGHDVLHLNQHGQLEKSHVKKLVGDAIPKTLPRVYFTVCSASPAVFDLVINLSSRHTLPQVKDASPFGLSDV